MDDLSLFFFFDKDKKELEITHTANENNGGVQIFSMVGNNIGQMEAAAQIGLMCFNMGNMTNGEGTVSVTPEIGVTLLADAGITEVDKLVEMVKNYPTNLPINVN